MTARRVPGWVCALALFAVLPLSAWAGCHGFGVYVGATLCLAAIFTAIIVGGAWFAGWAVRAIRAELGIVIPRDEEQW